MRRKPQGEIQMQRRMFLAQLFVLAKCGRPARMHRQTREKKGETMKEEERRSGRLKHRGTSLGHI